MNQLVESLLDEDEGDQAGKVLLCEAGDVADEGTGVCRYQDHEDQAHPEARAEAEGQVGPAKRSVSGRSQIIGTK